MSYDPNVPKAPPPTEGGNRALYFIHADILHRQSPRVLDGAKRLCADLDDARRSAR